MSKQDFLYDERLIIQFSGEIPEIAYHGSLYFLMEDPEGPGLELERQDILSLEEMVIERYKVIILRDLNPDNRDKGLYRGLKRSAVNWKRLMNFCRKGEWDVEEFRKETAAALKSFLEREAEDVRNGLRTSCINCRSTTLEKFASKVGLAPTDFPSCWQELCRG